MTDHAAEAARLLERASRSSWRPDGTNPGAAQLTAQAHVHAWLAAAEQLARIADKLTEAEA